MAKPGQAATVDFPAAWGTALEKWIDQRIRGGALEPRLLDLRETLPGLYKLFVAELWPAEPPP